VEEVAAAVAVDAEAGKEVILGAAFDNRAIEVSAREIIRMSFYYRR
jgi:hypothetical protein